MATRLQNLIDPTTEPAVFPWRENVMLKSIIVLAILLCSTANSTEIGLSSGTSVNPQTNIGMTSNLFIQKNYLRFSISVSRASTLRNQLSQGEFSMVGSEISTIWSPTKYSFIHSGIGVYFPRNIITYDAVYGMEKLGYHPEERFKPAIDMFFSAGVSLPINPNTTLSIGGKFTTIHTDLTYNLYPMNYRLRGDPWTNVGMITSNRCIDLSTRSWFIELKQSI